MTKQKNRPSEQQSRSTTQAAEAVALGTMAGGLALGAAQAREAQPLPDDESGIASKVAEPMLDSSGERQTSQAEDAPYGPLATEDPSSEARLISLEHDTLVTPQDYAASREISADALTPAVHHADRAVAAVESQAISGASERPMTEPGRDNSPEGAALPPARPMAETVSELAPAVQPPFQDLAGITGFGNTLHTQIETTLHPSSQLLSNLPDSLANTIKAAIAETGLEEIAQDLSTLSSSISQTITGVLGGSALVDTTAMLSALPQTIGSMIEVKDTGSTIASVADIAKEIDIAGLPATVLGSDGPIADTGLLSTLFYSDGEAEVFSPLAGLGQSGESLLIPQLSQSAASLLTDTADSTLGLLALSYNDLSPDGFHPATGGIGGLGLL